MTRYNVRVEMLCPVPGLWQRIKDRFRGIKWKKVE